MVKIGQITTLVATLLTVNLAAEKKETTTTSERNELVTTNINENTDKFKDKVESNIKRKEEEARQDAEMRKNILEMTEEQFEEIKAEIDPQLELMKPQEVMAFAQAYVKALKPELDKANQELDKYKQAVKDAPKGSEERTKAIKDYKEFKGSSAYALIEERYDYFKNHASTANLVMEEQETTDKNKKLAEKDKKLAEKDKKLTEKDKKLTEKDAEIKRTGDKLRAAIAAKLASQSK